MSLFFIAGALLVYPSPSTWIAYWSIIHEMQRQHLSGDPDVLERITFRSLILGVGIACSTVHATFSSGFPVQACYEYASRVLPEQYKRHILNILSSRDRCSDRGWNTVTASKSPADLLAQDGVRLKDAHHKILLDTQSQLHIHCELAMVQGTSLESPMLSVSQRAIGELVNVAIAEAEKSAVKLAGPLALCFLPAFILLGVIPTIISFSQGLLGV